MRYSRLGTSGIEVSVVALGCMTLGTDMSNVRRIIHTALDLGVTLFDTADLYDRGINEELVGEALRDVRSRVVIATKVGNRARPDGSGWDWDPTPKYILQEVHESLRRLKTDHIDLYQLHGGTIEDSAEETAGAFEQLQKEGKIRAWGISSIRPNVVRRYAVMAAGGSARLTSEMVQYSLLDRRPEEEILETASRAGFGILVRGAVAGGLLAGKPASNYLDLSAAEVQAVQETLREMAVDLGAGSGTAMAQAAVRFVLGNPAVTAVVAGASRAGQVETIAAAADAPPLSAAQRITLGEAVRRLRYTSHR